MIHAALSTQMMSEQQGKALQTLNEIQLAVKELQLRLTAAPVQKAPTRESLKDVSPPPPTKFFTGREDILVLLAQGFQLPSSSTKQRKYVLHGLGGIGKTQVVLKFLQLQTDK